MVLLFIQHKLPHPFFAGVAAVKKAKLQFIDLIHELIQDVVSGQLFDGLAVDEQHRLALAAGNADVCFTGFTGAVDPRSPSRPP